jgi:hypothetical protein
MTNVFYRQQMAFFALPMLMHFSALLFLSALRFGSQNTPFSPHKIPFVNIT